MSFLKKIPPPIKIESWRQFCKEVRGVLLEGGPFQADRVQVQHKGWTITLGAYTVPVGEYGMIFTQMSTQYIDESQFRFRLYRKGFNDQLDRSFDALHITVEDAELDSKHIIFSNDADRARGLLSIPTTRELIKSLPFVYLLEVKESRHNTLNDIDVAELYFQAPLFINDLEQLRNLYKLFVELLDCLAEDTL